jgi:hypothetical protein
MLERRGFAAGRFDKSAWHPRVPWLIAIAFATAGAVAIQEDTFLNNEGVLTWIFAGVTSEAPRDMLFFLHARPPISLWYAPVAALGLTPFLWVHMLLAALAIPLTASLARSFDHESPNRPAVLVALSPLFFAGAAAGVQNTDATVGLLFVAWLMARKLPAIAGCVLSLVVLARAEIALFALALAVYAAATPGCRRLLWATLVIPAVYLLFGARYHGSLLWPLIYPPSLTSNPTIAAAERAWYGGTFSDLVTTALALTPAIGMLMWTSVRGRSSLENTVSITAIAFVAVIRILPFTNLIYVDASPRYVLPALPFLCLAVSRAVDGWGHRWQTSLSRSVLLLGIAGLVGMAVPQSAGSRDMEWLDGSVRYLLFAATGACVASSALAFASKRAATTTLLAATVAFAVPLLPSTHLFNGDEARQYDASARWIAAQVPQGGTVVTDEHLLGIWLAEYAPQLHVDVRHLVTPDMLYQIRTLTNPATRQFEEFFGTSRFFYAPWIFADEIASLPGDVFFVMRGDPSPHPRNLSAPPFDRVEWLIAGDWVGGRLVRDARSTSRTAGGSEPGVNPTTARRVGHGQ